MIDVNEFSHSLGSIVATAHFIEKVNKEFEQLEAKVAELEKKLSGEAVNATAKKKTTAKAE